MVCFYESELLRVDWTVHFPLKRKEGRYDDSDTKRESDEGIERADT
jgi:hypothetical protein